MVNYKLSEMLKIDFTVLYFLCSSLLCADLGTLDTEKSVLKFSNKNICRIKYMNVFSML